MTDRDSAMGLLYTTWPDAARAEAAAETLLAEGLIACANILGQARSIFRWGGDVQREVETIALFKTSQALAETVTARLAELHPYDEPAILNLSVERTGSSHAFVNWVEAETTR